MSMSRDKVDELGGQAVAGRWEAGGPSVAQADPAENQPVEPQPEGEPSASATPQAAARTPAAKAPVQWAWNRPLLAVSLFGAVSGSVLLVGLYHWQSDRVGEQLRQLVEAAQADQDAEQEVLWLQRYLALHPEDVEAQIELAWAFDAVASSPAETNQARRYFNRAIAAADATEETDTRDALRRRLIDRLLQLGGGWFVEAERQIVSLNATPRDPDTLEQLARSLLGQAQSGGERASAPANGVTRHEHFWKWAAGQPVGEVLRMAVEAKPDSSELAAALVTLCVDRPELFDAPGVQADRSSLRAEATRILETLSKRRDDGHAQWVAYYYGQRPGLQVPLAGLPEVAALALQRLQRNAVSLVSPTSEAGGAESSPPSSQENPRDVSEDAGRQDQDYEPRWDAELVLQQATHLYEAGSFGDAEQLFEALASLPPEMLAMDQAEQAFRGVGRARWQLGEHDLAQEAWRTGNEQLGGARLVLLEPLAATSAQLAPLDQAKRAVEELAAAAETTSLSVAAMPRHDRRRSALQSRINSISWRVEVFRAQIDARENRRDSAVVRLERALASQLTIETALRIEAADLLAKIYGEQNLWDLAGRVLDEAVLLDPRDRSLRMRAADAWQRASVPSRAAGHLQHADDGSFETALAYAQTLATAAARRAPALRELGQVHAAIAEAERRLERAMQEAQAVPTAWRLGLLKLSVPTPKAADRVGSGAEGGNTPAAKAQANSVAAAKMQLLDLCLQYPQAAELQAIAAFSLQRLGDPGGADEAVRRLEAIPDVDPVLVLETVARLMAQRGAVDDAVQKLREFAAAHPEHRLRTTKSAVTLLDSVGRRSEATELLRQLEPQERDISILMQLGIWLLETDSRAPAGETSEKGAVRFAELQEIERQLRKLEGEEGTYWRWIAANRLLHQAAGNSQPSSLLSQAALLQAEIAARRPRWSRGLTLGGRIAIAQGNPQQAVELFRRAISEGDQEVDTVLLLVRQLNRLGDGAAAEQELGRLEHLPDSTGQIAAMSVELALGNGNYTRAVERARRAVRARPKDADGLLILAQTAFLAAKADPQKTETLEAEAADALERAIELTQGGSLGVWNAQFRFKRETQGEGAAREVLAAIEGSSLPDTSRWLAVAQGYLALGDWQEAQPRLENAKQISPSDVNVHLTFADLHQAANDSESMLNALETANRLAPEREDISRRLAFALVATYPLDVPWQRISELIGADSPDGTQKNQLYHALLLITRGGDEQIEQARNQLRRLMKTDDPTIADDAARVLLTVERRKWSSASGGTSSVDAKRALGECRRLYDFLTQRKAPTPIDLYRYGDFLLRAEMIPDAAQITERLAAIAPTSRLALGLRLRVEKKQGNGDQLAPIVADWLDDPANARSPAAKAAAGLALSSLDSHLEAIELLEQAYSEDPREYQNYITVLSQAGQLQRAADICTEHFRKDRSPEPVALLAELLVRDGGLQVLNAEMEQVLTEGLTEFSHNPRVLESIGTLRLTQQQYAEAIAFYSQAEKLDPNRLITLNNLAMALIEIPGREEEGLSRIQRAVEIYGRNPELLDTLGLVQLHCKQLAEAEATLREAYTESKNTRHQFHLLLVLHARHKMAEAQQLWNELDLRKLEASNLTPSERKLFDELQQQLGKTMTGRVGGDAPNRLRR